MTTPTTPEDWPVNTPDEPQTPNREGVKSEEGDGTQHTVAPAPGPCTTATTMMTMMPKSAIPVW